MAARRKAMVAAGLDPDLAIADVNDVMEMSQPKRDYLLVLQRGNIGISLVPIIPVMRMKMHWMTVRRTRRTGCCRREEVKNPGCPPKEDARSRRRIFFMFDKYFYLLVVRIWQIWVKVEF